MDIPVRIVGGETVLVTFTGVGYDQRIMGDTLPVRDMGSTTVPAKQVVQVPKQVCVSVTAVTAICCNVSKVLVISWLVMQSSVLVIQHFSSAFEHF